MQTTLRMGAEITTPCVLRGLYAITDTAHSATHTLMQQVEQALLGGAALVQYRDKGNNAGNRLQTAQQLKQLCRSYHAALIINDDLELALQVQADGIHLGRQDTPLHAARRVLGKKSIIGISCYNQFQNAQLAQAQGANYIAFGSFYPSPTKPHAVRADIELLQRAKNELQIPVCAIGGITAENAAPLITAGADMLAVISALFHTPDIQGVARKITQTIQQYYKPVTNRAEA